MISALATGPFLLAGKASAPSADCLMPERAEGIRFVVMVRAVTVIPGQQVSVALMDMPEPPDDDGPVLVQTQAVGICGTDLEIINSRPLFNQRHRLASLVTAQSATKMIKITAANRPKRS